MPATQELLHQGRYRVGQPLDPSMDTVFTAYDTVSNVNVVVKEIPVTQKKVTTLSQQESSKLAFTNQAQAMKDLRHDSLLVVEDFFCDVGRQFLVLESLDGRSLETEAAGQKGPMDVSLVSRWTDQILDALAYIASIRGGMVHGRINPRNIYICEDGRVKLLAVGTSDSEVTLDTSLSKADDSAYINYSSLEQLWNGLDPASQKVISNSYDERSESILNEPPDVRSDIYSLGAVMYHLVTGIKPVDPLERSIEILDSKPDPLKSPKEFNAEVSGELSEFIMKALEIRRELRFDNAAVMRQALRTMNARIAEETDDDLEMQEAAKELKYAVSARKSDVDKLVEAKKRELEEEQEKQRRELETKLREAEEQRVLAEQRAADAERLLREKEEAAIAAAAETEASPVAEALPEMPSAVVQKIHDSAPPVATARKDRPAAEVSPAANETTEQAEMLTVVPEVEVSIAPEPAEEEIIEAAVASEDISVRIADEPAEAFEDSDEDAVLSYGAAPGRSLPIPAIAGGSVAILLIAVGVWFFALRPAPAVPAAAVTPAVSEPVAEAPAEVQTQAPADPAASAFQDNAAAPETTESDFVEAQSPEPASVAKPKKPAAEPAKPKAETPKKVTVDDLINDN